MKNFLITFVFVLCTPCALQLNAQVMTTLAGTPHVLGFSGDGGPAGDAEFAGPYSVANDRKGNIYIVDLANFRIREVNTSGIITTIVGGGSDLTIEGIPATDALIGPLSVAADAFGNLYAADDDGFVVKMDTNGILTTFAGSGLLGYTGDGGPATAAAIGAPEIVAIDKKGNVYFADNANFVVRKVNTAGIISTVAGNASLGGVYSGDGGAALSAGLDYMGGLAVDNNGNLFISDYVNCVIRKVDTFGIINRIAGPVPIFGIYSNGCSGDGGPAIAAFLCQPMGLSVDRNGNLYICDQGNQAIREINSLGIINTVAGEDTLIGYSGDGDAATNAKLSEPIAVALDSTGDIYIADYGNAVIRKVIINGVAGVKNINSVSPINIFPNPVTSGNLLKINNVPGNSSYSISTIVGETLQQGRLQQGDNTISVSTLPPDVYLLEITAADGTKTVTKIIKQG